MLNGRSTVNPELAALVHAAVRELGYRPNGVARNLRRRQTTLWAMLVSDVGNPFFTSLVRGVEDGGRRFGYSVVLCNTDESREREAEYIAVALADNVAGVIISPADDSTDISALVAAGTAVVTIDRELAETEVDAVLVDNEKGAEQATTHLLESGYRRIACITGPRRMSTAMRRLRGHLRALRAFGVPQDRALIRHADFREEGGYSAMAALLDEGVEMDAVFAANNLMTVGAVECLTEREVPIVPGRLGVIGFDDIPWARLFRPGLSTVRQSTYELGRAAAQLLAGRIDNPARPAVRMVLQTELHPRESSGPGATWAVARRPPLRPERASRHGDSPGGGGKGRKAPGAHLSGRSPSRWRTAPTRWEPPRRARWRWGWGRRPGA
ncbi:LacI family transcriptional regulator [Nonomuraea solani]|uniref:LacI family transcriptional regulator n=1 Tax=Nonomuraea solani TaxID=1144553 RepID=A0A1H6ETU8_9ACTN|nr:LacI family DNA-binding transcriptional regulator [Nonomuraea solani]SEH01290.1 LacI family transcriptional regulator [Nonomuraea solani]